MGAKAWKVRVQGRILTRRASAVSLPEGDYLMREVDQTYGYEFMRGASRVAQLSFSQVSQLQRNGELTIKGRWP